MTSRDSSMAARAMPSATTAFPRTVGMIPSLENGPSKAGLGLIDKGRRKAVRSAGMKALFAATS